MAKEKSRIDIIAVQGETIQRLQDEIYNIMITGEIPKLTSSIRKRKSFKRFIKSNEDVKNMIDNKTNDLQLKLKKMEKLVKKHNLDGSLHITNMRYVRIATFMDNIDQLLHDIVNCKEEQYELPNGYKINPKSLRYGTFNKNLTCVGCGIKGKFLALERCLSDKGGNEGNKEGQGFHLNLYALDEMGREVLMTKDHIIPKSKGGPDVLENMQTMCTYCNFHKQDNIPDDIPEQLIKLSSRVIH